MQSKTTFLGTLKNVEQEPNKRLKAILLLDAVREMAAFGKGDTTEVVELLNRAEILSQEIDYALGIARVAQLRGQLAFFRMDYDTAFAKSNEAIRLLEALGEEARLYLAESLMGLSMATWDSGDYSRGLDLAFKGMRHCEDIGNQEMGGVLSYMIGSFYLDLKDYKNAKKYFLQGYERSTKANTRRQSIARCIIGLGSIALVSEEYEEAISYFTQAEEIQLEIGDNSGLGRSYNDLGKVYFKRSQYEEAALFFQKSIALRENLGNLTGLITTLIDFSEMYIAQDRLQDAKPMLERALELSLKLNTKAKQYRAYKLLGELHKKKGEWEQALHFFNEFYELKEKVQGEDFSFEIRKLEKRMEIEKKEKESEIYRLKNVELKSAYERIEKKNRDITASINYAKRIQDAMLHDMSGLKDFVKDYFILFKPRDIVSGDFYWYTSKGGKAFVAAVDCTGHGVPGAFMSLIGNSLLDQAVHLANLSCPADILTYLNQEVQRLLHQSEGDNNDGMDMGICVIDPEARMIEFAGAKNPLIFIQNEELTVIKGNRMPVGGTSYVKKHVEFTKHSMPIEEGSRYYLLSDGFQDQFGGLDGGKYKIKRLKQDLLNLQKHTMPEQKKGLEKVLKQWMGNERQVDDILILGLSF